jgi:hypothetical protein
MTNHIDQICPALEISYEEIEVSDDNYILYYRTILLIANHHYYYALVCFKPMEGLFECYIEETDTVPVSTFRLFTLREKSEGE